MLRDYTFDCLVTMPRHELEEFSARMISKMVPEDVMNELFTFDQEEVDSEDRMLSARLDAMLRMTAIALSEIQQAFERVGLDPYINGYFCKANLALEKNSPEFYQAILESLGDSASQVTMVGDNLDKDIYPALEAGLQAIYYNPQRTQVPEGINSVSRLSKLLTAN